MEKYFTILEAKEKIKELKKQNTATLYIERLLKQKDGTLFADIEGIADFSDASVEESYRASLNYFSEYGKDSNELFLITY